MTTQLFQVFLTQFLILKAMASYGLPYSLSPYITRESPQISQKPYVTERAYHQNYPPNYAHPGYKKSEPVLLQVVNPPRTPDVTSIKSIPAPNHLEIPNKCSGNLDSHVLNNLAIALQLLIVNNIINNPPPEPNHLALPLAETMLEMALPLNKLNVQDHELPFPMPNSKFLGSSNFGNDVMSKGIIGLGSLGSHSATPFSRSGINLMSPYDAIANSVPLSEAITSSYLSKKDFQSPYAAILAADLNRDLFSMDFF